MSVDELRARVVDLERELAEARERLAAVELTERVALIERDIGEVVFALEQRIADLGARLERRLDSLPRPIANP